jgi:hypothetical protein
MNIEPAILAISYLELEGAVLRFSALLLMDKSI